MISRRLLMGMPVAEGSVSPVALRALGTQRRVAAVPAQGDWPPHTTLNCPLSLKSAALLAAVLRASQWV